MLRMKRIMRIAPDLADVPFAKASAEPQSHKPISNREKEIQKERSGGFNR